MEILHKSPPVFKRITHKTPPKFSRESLNPTAPSNSKENISILPESLKGELKIENISHRKPPIFAKSEKKAIESKTSEAFSESPAEFSQEKDEFSQSEEESHSDAVSFTKKGPKLMIRIPSQKKIPDSYKAKEEMLLRNESNSIGSAIMHLQGEIIDSGSHKPSADFQRNFDQLETFQRGSIRITTQSNSSSSSLSGYSSDSQSPKNIFNSNNSQSKRHKTPPIFLRNKLDFIINKANSDSSISKSITYSRTSSLSGISSNLNSPVYKLLETYNSEVPNLNLSEKKNQLTEGFEEKLGDSSFISGISNVSQGELMKKKLKSSFAMDASILERSRINSPFISNNYIDKGFSIPMQNINYLERLFTAKKINFPGEYAIPEPPAQQNLDFSYPSIRKGLRHFNSAVTIFSEQADLYFSIKSQAALIPLAQSQQKYSKYNLPMPLTSEDIEKMAVVLANNLIRGKPF